VQVIDFFRFPVSTPSERDLFRLGEGDFRDRLRGLESPRVAHSMMALFDSEIVWREEQAAAIAELSVSGCYSFAYMPEVEGRRGEEQIERAAAMGCRAVVFHPYLQQVGRDRHARLQVLARYAAERGMIICVCAAYGSRNIYHYYPLEAVVAVAEAVAVPVVIVHGGGAKVLEAFLIAEAFPHIYLDTSFSLHYWMGSTVEEEFAFAIRRLGVGRWMFGSDAPFRPLGEVVEQHHDFCRRHGFGPEEVDQLMCGTAASLLGV